MSTNSSSTDETGYHKEPTFFCLNLSLPDYTVLVREALGHRSTTTPRTPVPRRRALQMAAAKKRAMHRLKKRAKPPRRRR